VFGLGRVEEASRPYNMKAGGYISYEEDI